MLNLAFAAMSSITPCSLSATLTKTGAPSGGNVDSNTVTVTVPFANSGSIQFASFAITGSVITFYSKNGGAFTSVTEGNSVTFASGDTLAVRGGSMTAGEAWTFSLVDNTSTIGTYTITAS